MGGGALSNTVVKLIICTIIIGAFDVGLTVNSYMHYQKEEFFLGVVILALTLSSIVTILALFDKMAHNNVAKSVSAAYHGLMAPLLFVGAVCMSFQTSEYRPMKLLPLPSQDDNLHLQRIFACALGFLNSLVYGYIAYVLINFRV